jgi:hypothetical protein
MEKTETIGVATMRDDGAIVLMLSARGSQGEIGDAQFVYPQNHPQYANVLRHLGGLEKGETKPVRPFD